MSILQLYMEKKIERDVLFKKNILDMIKKYCKHLSCYYMLVDTIIHTSYKSYLQTVFNIYIFVYSQILFQINY